MSKLDRIYSIVLQYINMLYRTIGGRKVGALKKKSGRKCLSLETADSADRETAFEDEMNQRRAEKQAKAKEAMEAEEDDDIEADRSSSSSCLSDTSSAFSTNGIPFKKRKRSNFTFLKA